MFVPLGFEVNNTYERADDGTILAVGRSNRDYDFLVKVVSGTDYELNIVCDNYKCANLPPNVKVLNNCYGEDMLELMSRCHCVAIPLKDPYISSGQIVAIQAMSLGKPVVCTKCAGIGDYVHVGETGREAKNEVSQWRGILDALYADKERYNEMSLKAVEFYAKNYTSEVMFNRIASIVK